MSKKLFRTIAKVAAVVGTVAAVATGVGAIGVGIGIAASTLTAVSAIASVVAIGASALGKPKSPKTPPANLDRLQVTIDPRTPRKMVLGRTAMATDLRDQEYTGNQDYLHRFIVVASHKVQAIESIYFDDKLAWTVGGGAQGEFVGYLTVTPILEGNAGNAINISARMGSTRRYTGLAYVHIQYELTGNSKKTASPFAQSIASRMTIIGKGLPTYDPRLDTTVGGSGTQRANDQTTWVWSDNASNNPAIQLLNYYLGWKIAGKLAVGKGIPAARIDMASFITAANICDETVALAAGGTQPRYRTAGIVSESDSLDLVNDNFKAAMNAELDDADGKIRLTVLHNDLASPVADFTDDDVLGNVQWQPVAPLNESFNAIRGIYTDPSTNSLYQQVDYPQPTPLTSPDGIERMLPFDLPLVENAARAQRLAKQRLQREQYTGTLSFEGNSRYWKVQKNDIIRQTFTPLGMTLKLFRVVSISTRVDGVVPIVLREENAALYAWSAEDSAAVAAAAPTLYDFTKNPQYLDLADALLATVDLTLTAIGTSPPLIQGNKVTSNAGADTYETMVRGQLLAGACFAEADIAPSGSYTMIGLDASATDKSYNNQDLHAVYYPATGALGVYRNGTTVFNSTIASGLTGKMQVAYDGVRYRVFVAGTEQLASLTTYPAMAAAAPPLTHYPKWTPYTNGSILTGLRAGPFSDNNFGSIGGAGTPDPYSTSGDNLVANAALASNAVRWVLSGATLQAGSAGDPAPSYFNFPAGAGATATINDGAVVQIAGASKIYCSGYAYKVAGAAGNFQIVVEYYKADGAVSAIRTQDATTIMPGSSAAWVAFNFSLTPPADAASIRAYAYGSNTTSAVRLAGGLRVAKTEPAADVTSSAKVAVEMASDKTVAAAYDGTVASGDLSELRWSPKVTKGGVSIKGENSTSYTISNPYGGTFAVDNTNGSSTKGDITQSAITANTAGGELTITVNGVAEPKLAFKVTKSIAAPPPVTGGGSTKTISWMAGDWIGINTTSYTAVNTLKSIAVASGETLYATGILDVNVSGNGGVSRTMTLKVQYSATGANSWNDFPGGGHTSSTATSGVISGPPDFDYTDPVPGSVTMTDSKGGLSAATYDVRVVGIDSATGKTCTPSGTLTVEAKV